MRESNITQRELKIIQNNISISSQTKYPVEHESISLLKSWSKWYYSKNKQDSQLNTSKNQSITNDLSWNVSSEQKPNTKEIFSNENSKCINDINDLDETQLKSLIQPLPYMQSKSNYRTFREGSFSKSIKAFKSIVDVKGSKLESKAESRNKKSILFPTQTKSSISPQFSVSNNAYSLTTTVKVNRQNLSLVQWKKKMYRKE